MAHAIPALESWELHPIQEGSPDATGNMAVVAVGTGLGEAFLTRRDAGWIAHPSEGGHTDFAPTTQLQEGLLSFLRRSHDHVSYERVCSGLGLPNIYAYLKRIGFAPEPAWLRSDLEATSDWTPTILAAAQDESRRCPLCEKTLEVFLAILGAKAANVALETLATGGVLIGGGVPPRVLPALGNGTLVAAFLAKGRLRPLLEKVPVHVIVCPEVAMVGAACRGLGRALGPPSECHVA